MDTRPSTTENRLTLENNTVNSFNDASNENAAAGPSVQIVHQPLVRLTGHTDVLVGAEWVFGAEQVITASWDRTANLYDAESGQVVSVLSGHDHQLTHCNAHGSQVSAKLRLLGMFGHSEFRDLWPQPAKTSPSACGTSGMRSNRSPSSKGTTSKHKFIGERDQEL
jgi:WD40 repeat protein